MSKSGQYALRMEQLRQTAPEAYDLVCQLSPEYQEHLVLTFPIWGDAPYIAVELAGKILKPADPIAFRVCYELTRMLWTEAPAYLRCGMAQAQRMRSRYPDPG